MDRIKRISMEILQDHKEQFGVDFDQNKKTLDNISIIRSKELKNELAGYITKFLKHELREIKENEEREKQSKSLEETIEEQSSPETTTENEIKSPPSENPKESEETTTT